MENATPEQWIWIPQIGEDLPKLVRASDGSTICSFGNIEQYYPTAGTPPERADGQLMAAAPTLLAALISARKTLDMVCDRMHKGVYIEIDRAIAEATVAS